MAEPINRRAFLGTTVASTLLSRCSFNPCPPAVQSPPLPECRGGYLFQNWAETISCRPSSYCQPRTVGEVVDLVKKAAQSGKTVRTVGAGHSWSPLVLTSDVLVNLDNLQAVVDVDGDRQRATVQAGIRLKNLIPALRAHGLGMANLGSVTEQSIAGAVGTGTHGTGLPFGSLSTQVVGMKIVSGTGDIVAVEGGDRLRAARIGLGALGVVTEVTLQCVPDHELEYAAYWCDFDEVVGNLETLVRENERLRLWWLVWTLGCRRHVIVTTMNRPGTPAGWLGRFPGLDKGGRSPLPMETEALFKKRPGKGEPACFRFQRHTAPYNEVLNVPLLRVLHRECEYAVPLARMGDALRACQAFFDDHDVRLLMPVEVRFVKSDDVLLSPSLGRDVGYIGVSVRDREKPTEVFAGFEQRMRRLDGRPHWGKFFTLDARQAKELYPDTYDTFNAIRKELDPRGVFVNDPIRQLFG
jgi:FAD/FMN-containing dehydrogenase